MFDITWKDCFIISIHAPRAGSDNNLSYQQNKYLTISIHAPRAGSDCWMESIVFRRKYISIHAPRAGSDQLCRARSY